MVQLWYNFRLLRFNLSFIYTETMEHPLVNDTSTLVGHFVSSPREREKRDRKEIVEKMKEGDREEQGWKWRNRRNKNIPLYPYLLQGQQVLPNCKPISVGCPSDVGYIWVFVQDDQGHCLAQANQSLLGTVWVFVQARVIAWHCICAGWSGSLLSTDQTGALLGTVRIFGHCLALYGYLWRHIRAIA